MKKLMYLVMAIAMSLFAADASAQYIPVTASSCIVDGSGSTITSGTLIVVGTDSNDNPVVYRAGTTFITTTAPITKTITAGSVPSFQLADPSSSSPLNVSYRFVVQDNTTKKITVYKGINITPNDTLVSGSFTTFNICKMNPGAGVASFGGFTTPSLVSGDWTVTRDLIVGRNSTIAGTLGVTGIQTNSNANSIRYVTGFPSTGATELNNAENDCSTANCIVHTPSSVACGAGQSLATKDNIFVEDMRSCTGLQQAGTHLFYNVKDTNNGAVRDKMMLVDAFTPANVMSAASSSASLYVHTYLEGNLTGLATLESFNGTVTVDTGATNSPSVVAGIEGEASVSGTTANTLADVRGGTFNAGLTGAGSATNITSLVAQTITNTGTGSAANAFSFIAENQTIGTSANGGIWNKGNGVNDKPTSFGSFSGGIVPQAGTMVFIRPTAGQLTGGTQIGLQVAPITSSAATSTGIGIMSRADLGSAFTQTANYAFRAQTPSLNGGTITNYRAFVADPPPTGTTTDCVIEMDGATSGSTCFKTSAVAGGTAAAVISTSFTTTAATTDNVTVTGMTSTGHCKLQPTNSTAAAGIASVFVSAKAANQITVTHTATSGWTFDVMCSPI